jgi:hypothetical protein
MMPSLQGLGAYIQSQLFDKMNIYFVKHAASEEHTNTYYLLASSPRQPCSENSLFFAFSLLVLFKLRLELIRIIS